MQMAGGTQVASGLSSITSVADPGEFRGFKPPGGFFCFFVSQFENSYGPAFKEFLNPPLDFMVLIQISKWVGVGVNPCSRIKR